MDASTRFWHKLSASAGMVCLILAVVGIALSQIPATRTCELSLSPAKTSVPSGGAFGEVLVRPASKECTWNPSTQVNWVSVSLRPPGTLSTGAFEYSVQENYSPKPRDASVEAGDQTFQITQAARKPSIAAGPGRLSFEVSSNVGEPQRRTLTVWSEDCDLMYRVSPRDKDREWLSVKAGDGAGKFEVSVDPKKLVIGDHLGEVAVQASGAQNSPLVIPVKVTVSPGVKK